MENRVEYKGFFIDVIKDVDPYNPMEAPDLYEDDLELQKKEYLDYLSGEVYGFVILDKELNIVDSIWGYYGTPQENNITEKGKERIDRYYIKPN